MIRYLLAIIFILSVFTTLKSQNVGISENSFTPNANAILDLKADRKGFLVPRMDLTPTTFPSISASDSGLMVFNTAVSGTPNFTEAGFYYWDGTSWQRISNDSETINGSGTQNYLPKWDNASGDNLGNSQIYDDGTNVGIGSSSPDQKLEIGGGGIQLNGSYGIGFAGDLPYDGNAISDQAKVYYDHNFFDTNEDGLIFEKTDGNANDPDGGIAFTNKGSDNVRETSLVIRGNGNVAIGSTVPGEKLDVNGKIRMRTGATDGYIPVSDANGIMTWTDPTQVTANDDDWEKVGGGVPAVGDDVYHSGSVGIGTNDPGSKLHVDGGGISVQGSLPTDVWGQVIGLGSSGSSGSTQGIIGHQGSHNLDIYWNFHRIASSSDYTGLSSNSWTSANGISLGNNGITFHSTNTMGSGKPSERMRIENGGNIGIATSGPRGIFDVDPSSASDIYLSSYPNYNLLITQGDQLKTVLDDGSATKMYIQHNNNADIALATGSSTGNVGIGSVSPSAQLDIYHDGAGGAGIITAGEYLNISGFAPNITLVDNSTSTDDYAFHLNSGELTVGRYSSATSVTNDLVLNSGNVGVGTDSPSAKLDVQNGYFEGDRFWYRSYSNVSLSNSVEILGRDGNSLPTNFVGMVWCAISSTNAPGTSLWMVKKWQNGNLSIERIASFGSTSSNTPELYNDSGTLKMRLYNHASDYTVRVRVEQMW
jgi:hypothetical protein